MFYFYVLIAILVGTRAQDEAKKQNIPVSPENKQVPQYFAGYQNPSALQYDFSLLEPRLQLGNVDYATGKQVYPRVHQPQLVFYAGGAPPGQQFLLQPGAPPGNFLVPQPQPQPGPGIVLRDTPGRPLFVAGYPKPAHVPPIEKDAEEIPTDPAKIPKFPSSKKPEKLETFNEGKEQEKSPAGEQEVLAAADKFPSFISKKIANDLKPGQRFFILNGQSLFSNYPYQQVYPNAVPQRIEQTAQELYPQQQYTPPGFEQFQKNFVGQNQAPLQDLFLRNAVTGQISDVNTDYANHNDQFGQNFVSLNQPQDYKDGTYLGQQQFQDYSAFPFARGVPGPQDAGYFPKVPLGYYQYDTARANLENDDTVVIDAKVQSDRSQTSSSEGDKTTPEKPTPTEPSISQAQPGAIALAGPGGVAAAAPRGTALVGQGGLAVASPQATAVAGPSKDDAGEKRKKNSNKSGRQ